VDPEALFHEADAALYAAKRHGGNRLCTAETVSR
jgi:PleD family two-component response regulator